jgi:hypothetical protein
MAPIAVGVGLVFSTVVEAAAFLREGRVKHIWGRRSTMRAIDALQGHVLICGLGGDQPLQLPPGPDHELQEGDHVIALGDKENLERLSTLARASGSPD